MRTLPTTFAGVPATMARGSTGFSTSDPAPIMEPLPMVILPSTCKRGISKKGNGVSMRSGL